MFKKVFDILVSLVLLVILAPVMLIVGLIIFLLMGRPVLLTQVRPGFMGKPFKMLKFRTMNSIESGSQTQASDIQRTPWLGKMLRRLSLDELPQLINVLKGDMSLVGPRPLLMEYLELYTPEQFRRHLVRPGITGWAQVNGRNAITWKQKFNLDVWYVDNPSFLLDLKILLLTGKKVFLSQGINASAGETMTKFTGDK